MVVTVPLLAGVGWYLSLSLVAFVVFAADKHAARSGRRRVPEARLHLLELLGGFPGALLAITCLRHKSSKPSFLVVSILCVLVNLAIASAVFLVACGMRS